MLGEERKQARKLLDLATDRVLANPPKYGRLTVSLAIRNGRPERVTTHVEETHEPGNSPVLSN